MSNKSYKTVQHKYYELERARLKESFVLFRPFVFYDSPNAFWMVEPFACKYPDRSWRFRSKMEAGFAPVNRFDFIALLKEYKICKRHDIV